MSSSIPRPGITLGLYPEFRDQMSIKAVCTKNHIFKIYNVKKHGKTSALRRVAKEIVCNGEELESLSHADLKLKLDDVRFSLIRKGLIEKNVVQSFAIIREIASRTLGMRHHECQLMGGLVMINNMLAEMDTGEGKTLTATLVAGTAALAGIPTHVLTVNQYLAHRDAESMTPLYRELGLTVGVATDLESDHERRYAYRCDIAYCTGKQIAFDYLRDRMILKNEDTRLHLQLAQLPENFVRSKNLFLRGLCFAIVDEADSVLADEALNPLVIANQEASKEQELIYHQALGIAKELRENIDFKVDENNFKTEITDVGEAEITKLSESFGGIWSGKQRRLHICKLSLNALYLYKKDKHYLVEDDEVKIIDQNTGRLMQDRAWEQGLHQLIESKEDCTITGQRETLAKLTFQRFFRRYLNLAGMSGTAMDLQKELKLIYGLKVVRIPTHKPSLRKACQTWLFESENSKWLACVRRIKQLRMQNRPVLIGAKTIDESEKLSELLDEYGLDHQVLNARHTQEEANIISQAGMHGSIIVATNVAGRGTDIVLDKQSKENGGLHVIVIEQNDARRIDHQFYGRCARQGDPGSYEMFLSLESYGIQQFYPKWVLKMLLGFASRFGAVPNWIANKVIRLPQIMKEREQKNLRFALLKMDEQLEKLLSFTGKQE